MIGSRFISSSSARPVRRWLPALLYVAAFVLGAATQWPSTGVAQTLGIDCDQPRRNGDGKLILSDDGTARARCEADRATALNYAAVVRETRDRLRTALASTPPPLWDDLVGHLRTSDVIDDWTYDDDTVPTALHTVDDSVGRRAEYWAKGILQGTSYPDDWRAVVKARACGPDSDEAVLVWLDRNAIRKRWTPEMVQRAVRVRVQRTEGRNRLIDRIPDIVTASGQLKRYDGSLRPNMPAACLGVAPEGALALRVTLRRDIDTGRDSGRCEDPQVGIRRLMWARHTGVFLVPDRAILDDGRDHPRRGEPLLEQFDELGERPIKDPPLPASDYPVTDEENAMFLVSQTCRTPRTRDVVRTVECDAEINGTPVKGTHVRTYRFREVQETTKPYKVSMVPVMRDPDDHDNPLGVIAPAGNPHPVWKETTLFCEGELSEGGAPDIEEPVVDPDWTVPDCRAAHGGRFDYGTRKGYVQTITYPDGWPIDDVKVRTIEDDCFRQVEQTGSETRDLDCPAGHSGKIIQRRSFRWYNRDWAVPSRHDNGKEGDRTFDQALAAYRADPAQAGKEWYDTVVLVRDWHLDRLTCTAPRKVTDTQTRTGTCPAGQTGRRTERRTLSWYNRDPGATPPHVITDREVAQAAAAYDANPSQSGLAWYGKVTATQWATHSSRCRVPTPPTPSTPTERTCGNTCAERGGIAGRNSGGEYCRSPKLPKCSGSGGNGGNSGGDRDDPSQDRDNDGYDHRTDPDDNDPSVGCGCGEGGNNPGVED